MSAARAREWKEKTNYYCGLSVIFSVYFETEDLSQGSSSNMKAGTPGAEAALC